MIQEEEEPSLPITPPNPNEEDLPRPGVSLYTENSSLRMRDPLKKPVKGGSLYASMSQTAYTLAPAATLMGMASYMMRKKKSLKGKKSSKSRKSRKSQKKRR